MKFLNKVADQRVRLYNLELSHYFKIEHSSKRSENISKVDILFYEKVV